MAKKPPAEPKRIRNKKAQYRYEILDRIEAGIALTGTEVKSLRAGTASLEEAYAAILGDQMTLINCHIGPYAEGNVRNHEPLRKRRLLLHRREIQKIKTKVTQRGQTLVPLAIYFNDRGLAKVELGLVRGKQLHDKRETAKRREHERDVQRAMRRRR
jgi:SsrA-binding protein